MILSRQDHSVIIRVLKQTFDKTIQLLNFLNIISLHKESYDCLKNNLTT